MTAGVWRYVVGGAAKHRLPVAGSPVAVCGLEPWGARWRGGGSTLVELAELVALPECRNCVRRAR